MTPRDHKHLARHLPAGPRGNPRRRERVREAIMNYVPRMNRRSFVVGSAAAGGGLALGLNIPFGGPQTVLAQDGTPEVNAWVVIRPDDTVVVRVVRSEMGQGTYRALPDGGGKWTMFQGTWNTLPRPERRPQARGGDFPPAAAAASACRTNTALSGRLRECVSSSRRSSGRPVGELTPPLPITPGLRRSTTYGKWRAPPQLGTRTCAEGSERLDDHREVGEAVTLPTRSRQAGLRVAYGCPMWTRTMEPGPWLEGEDFEAAKVANIRLQEVDACRRHRAPCGGHLLASQTARESAGPLSNAKRKSLERFAPNGSCRARR